MLTIFTPTYDREHTLSRLYQSLRKQTDKDFEWIVVDDGSIDNTEILIQKFVQAGDIPIIYKKQVNGGKHRAINTALAEAHGDFFFIVDSDDYLPNNAVKIVNNYVSQIRKMSNIAGVCGFRAFPDGRVIAGNGIQHCIDMNSITIRERLKISGDMAEVYRTEILRHYPFPEFENEKFISEAVVWNRIAHKYMLRFFPEVIYMCEYQPDGLTRSIRKHHRNSPKGTMLYFNEIMKSPLFGCVSKIKAAINYWRYTIHVSNAERINDLKPVWWSFLFIPTAYYFLLKDLKE